MKIILTLLLSVNLISAYAQMDGINCWDLNANGVGDLPIEDLNLDGVVNVLDCAGADGINCWDLNADGIGDLASEDLNQDGVVNVMDCVGAPGANGVDGIDGQAGQDGVDGINCWDLNADGIGDLASEDLNQDGVVDVLDCAGAPGANGVDGENGQAGIDGMNGISCWDLNQNGIADFPDEDINLDGSVDVLDCHGAGSPSLPDDFYYNSAGDSMIVLIDGVEYILPVEPCPTDCKYSEEVSDLCQVFFIKTSVDCNGVEWVDTLGCKPLLDCNLGEITIEKKFSQTDVLLGDTINAIIPYCNSGGQPLTDIVVTDVIGPEFNLLTVNPSVGSWDPTNHELTWSGPLDPGQCESIIFELEVFSGEGLTHNIVTASADNGNGTKSTSAADNDFVIIEDPFIDPIARVTGGTLTTIGTDTDGDGVDDEFTFTGTTELIPEFVKEDGTVITTNEYYTATLTNICTNTLVDSWSGTLGTTDYISDGTGATDATNDLTGPIAHNTPFELDKRTIAIDANMTGEQSYGVWEICFTVGGDTSTCPRESSNTDNCTLIERILTTGGDNQAFPVDLSSNSPPDDPRMYQNYTEPFQPNNQTVNPFLDTLGSILQIPECAVRNFSASGLPYIGIQYSGVNQVAYIRELQMTDASIIDGRALPGADPIWGLAMGTGANAGTVNQLQYFDELFDYTSLVLNDPNIVLTESVIKSGAALSSRVGTYALSSNRNSDCSLNPKTIDATILEYQAPTCTGANAPFADTQIILNWNILKSETY